MHAGVISGSWTFFIITCFLSFWRCLSYDNAILLLKIKAACKKKKKKNCRFVLNFLPFCNCSLYSVLGIFPLLNHLFLIYLLLSVIAEQKKLMEPSLMRDSVFTCIYLHKMTDRVWLFVAVWQMGCAFFLKVSFHSIVLKYWMWAKRSFHKSF